MFVECLVRKGLKDLKYPDDKLIADIAAGFKLSGYMTKSNVFRARTKRPAMSVETLKRRGKSFNSTRAFLWATDKKPNWKKPPGRGRSQSLRRVDFFG